MSISARATAHAPLPPQERIVTDNELQKALDFLRDSAADLGHARAEMIRASHMVKVVKAIEMKAFNQLAANKAEVEALSSENYQKALERDAIAGGEFEKLRALREAAALKVESWRSEQASLRAMRI